MQDDSQPVEDVFNQFLGDIFGSLVILTLLFVLLVIIVIVVVVTLVIRARRRRSAPPPAPTGRPPGWYPVPDGSGRVARWDGQKWDDSTTPPSSA